MHHPGAALLGGALLTLPVLALAAACGGAAGAGHAGHTAAPPATIEQLAAKSGCRLTGTRGAEELRQGACRTARGRYTLVGFTTDQGQRAWLAEARPWGGTYLVGTRWVAVGPEPTLRSLRGELGGDILSGDAHHG
ncbi:hypothetical protein [Actinomadura macrotermitis]|uniref:Lipoprotein n=1 Tax=Actinomadura macrotermitis TaxID=2585200 RepID=A0A7K0BM69_9ACTN|nr:hypothetical protein [Actinomadura macrotermitis]MQY02278.1 hypothetical protein [Actinomadura macrotermitis]